MGNAQNKGSGKTTQLVHIIDFIATDYILTQNFTDMLNLTKEEYCDKLLILTSKIISKYLSNLEIDHLMRKHVNGELTEEKETSNVLYLQKRHVKIY